MLVCDNIPDSSAGVQSECSLQHNQQKNKQPQAKQITQKGSAPWPEPV
jgi:prophage tail gpP-like protein